jgi:hypothetical protein
LNPKIHGNRLIVYNIARATEAEVKEDVESIIESINLINSDERFRSEWIPSAFGYDQFKFSEKMKKAALSDASFWRILKSKVIVEQDVPLDSCMAYVSISDSVVDFLLDGSKTHPLDWPSEVKAIAFKGKTVPPDF